MQLQFRSLRKSAGYENCTELSADLTDFTARKMLSWENDERKISLEDACVVANFFGVTLDELAGRKPPLPDYGSRQANRLMEDFLSLSEEGKTAAANAVHGIRMGEEYAGEKGISSPGLSA